MLVCTSISRNVKKITHGIILDSNLRLSRSQFRYRVNHLIINEVFFVHTEPLLILPDKEKWIKDKKVDCLAQSMDNVCAV